MIGKFVRYGLAITAALLLIFHTSYAKSIRLDKSREAAVKEEWDQSLQLAELAIEFEGKSDAAFALIGDAQIALGDTAAAVKAYEEAVKIEPTNPIALLALTDFYIKNKRLKDAESLVAKAEKEDERGKIPEIKGARGIILADQGDFAEATRLLVSVAEKNKKSPIYSRILARLYNDRGVKEQAAIYYDQAVKVAPKDSRLAYEYALVMLDQKMYNEALDLLKKVQADDPTNKNVDYLMGRLYYAASRWGEAGQQFQKAAEKRPDHFMTQFLLGKSIVEFAKAEKKNFYKQAEVAYRKAIELRPDRTDVPPLLAEVLNIQGKVFYQLGVSDTTGQTALLCDSAISYTHQALAIDTTLAGSYSFIARCWNKIGNLDSVVFYTKQQLLKTPNDAIEFSRLVNALQRKKDQAALVDLLKPVFDKLDWTAAKDSADTSLKPQDEFINKYWQVLIGALVETKNESTAKAVLKSMVTWRPKWADGYVSYVSIEMNRSAFSEAVPVLKTAVANCPDNADLWLMLGDCTYFSNPKGKPMNKDLLAAAKAAYKKAGDLGNRDGKQKFEQLSGPKK